MATFEVAGFSAVDNFFSGKETRESSDFNENVKTTQGKVRRHGVGARAVNTHSDELPRRLLRVGRKRHLDEDDEEGVRSPDVQSEDEDETGRTGIASPKTLERETKIVEVTKVNKLGKKERQRQKQKGEELSSNMKDVAGLMDSEKIGTTEERHEGTNKGGKRKRKKIRSKQKNICKDNRSSDKKPKHLIPGSRNYRGGPLTEGTRKKLKLEPPSRVVTQHADVNFSTFTEEGFKLAVDQFLMDDQPPNSATKEDQNKKIKKRKKNRYKNLV